MKREVSREKILPAFALEIGDLESLLGRLLALFDKPDEVYCSIDITLPSESITFNNIQELKGLKNIPHSEVALPSLIFGYHKANVVFLSEQINFLALGQRLTRVLNPKLGAPEQLKPYIHSCWPISFGIAGSFQHQLGGFLLFSPTFQLSPPRFCQKAHFSVSRYSRLGCS